MECSRLRHELLEEAQRLAWTFLCSLDISWMLPIFILHIPRDFVMFHHNMKHVRLYLLFRCPHVLNPGVPPKVHTSL